MTEKKNRRQIRQEQLQQEQRMKNLKLLPIVIIIVALVGVGIWRIIEPDVPGIVKAKGLLSGHDQSVTYEDTGLPPMGGTHFPQWQRCGIYEDPVQIGYAVHSMEHGGIWLAYNPDTLTEEDVETLREAARTDLSWVLMAPYPDLEEDVVVTTWEKQLIPDSTTDERIKKFIERYKSQGPEASVFCVDGIGTPDES